MLDHLVIAACCIAVVMPAPAKIYDQRQTGDLNVRVDLKDVSVVALLDSDILEDYTNYDYFYDYADLTIKPSSRPTTSTMKTTEENDSAEEVTKYPPLQDSVVAAVSTFLSLVNSTDRSTTLSIDKATPDVGSSNGTANSASGADSTGNANNDKSQSSEKDEPSDESAVVASSTTVRPAHALRTQKRCKSGYIPNGDGRCRRRPLTIL